ncbi:MAG: HAD family phosphatase [Gloeocapsa sp. DLM2.Bin57]|nr:MAG: HAD family phosphatase [Gloeocapsa sp. DLM2.Bin57]
MSLEAVLLDFNSLIINDETIRQKALEEIIIGENLLYDSSDYRRFCLGRSPRDGLNQLLSNRGRILSETNLTKLIERQSKIYLNYVNEIEDLEIYPNFQDFLELLQSHNLRIAIVTGALVAEVNLVLEKTGLTPYINLIISGELVQKSKPDAESHLLACQKLGLTPNQCLAIETTFLGINAAKNAQIPVVGLANLYPVHILQRRANWVVDYLSELELERIMLKY